MCVLGGGGGGGGRGVEGRVYMEEERFHNKTLVYS